jgi:mRNA-degrading endonuclease YafQ of YafQ-DinJ toxin-antitoxin module
VSKIIYTETYIKRAKNFLNKHPEIISQYKKTLKLIEINIFHPSLRSHKLKGRLSDLYSVSINISYRICIDFIIKENTVIPIDIGKHDDVY